MHVSYRAVSPTIQKQSFGPLPHVSRSGYSFWFGKLCPVLSIAICFFPVFPWTDSQRGCFCHSKQRSSSTSPAPSPRMHPVLHVLDLLSLTLSKQLWSVTTWPFWQRFYLHDFEPPHCLAFRAVSRTLSSPQSLVPAPHLPIPEHQSPRDSFPETRPLSVCAACRLISSPCILHVGDSQSSLSGPTSYRNTRRAYPSAHVEIKYAPHAGHVPNWPAPLPPAQSLTSAVFVVLVNNSMFSGSGQKSRRHLWFFVLSHNLHSIDGQTSPRSHLLTVSNSCYPLSEPPSSLPWVRLNISFPTALPHQPARPQVRCSCLTQNEPPNL